MNLKLSYALVAIALLFTGAALHAGTWTPLANQPIFLNPPSQCALFPNADCAPAGYYSFGAILNANLLTDGSVLVDAVAFDDNGNFTFVEYKLIPDNSGSYVNGTWKQVASLPNAATSANPGGWGPYTLSSAVLPDGRVIYEGGEYNAFNFALDSRGAVYDPVQDKWTPVAPPSFFNNLYPLNPPDLPGYNTYFTYPRYPVPSTSLLVDAIGDSPTVVLPNGKFMIGSKLSNQQALLDPKTLTWSQTGAGKADLNSEEGWTLLPNGKVLTIDTELDYWFGITPTYNPGGSEVYDPDTGIWKRAGNTVSILTSFPEGEIGPAVLMPNGVVFAQGDKGNSALYDSYRNKWSAGPTLPTINLGGVNYQLAAGDTTAALLPSGNVLVSADVTVNEFPPTKFFEFDGRKFIPQPDIPNASIDVGVYMLELPSGQILEFDFSTDVEIYTPSKFARPWYAPSSLEVPWVVSAGKTYPLRGVYLNGVSQGAMEGDDYQSATNFPLVRITNLKTHHVFYSRTHDFSRMGVADPNPVSASFDVAATQEKGLSILEVVTNGVPSAPVPILVQ
jgi:hypothetical protein